MQLNRNLHTKTDKSIYKILLIFNIFAVAFLYSQKIDAQNIGAENNVNIYKDFKTEFVWEAKVNIADMINIGESKRGVRRVIPITGGTFAGPKIKGKVLPGGEDCQLVRPDGDTELNARYLLKTDDGYVIQINNNALMHIDAKTNAFYCKSFIDLEAPINSPYDDLNHAIYIGTLTMPELKQGEEPYVIIGVYKLL